MKKLILLLFLSLPVAVFGQQASKGSGIIVGIGGGHISSHTPSIYGDLAVDKNNSSLDQKVVMEAGYRFRLVPRKGRFFYDVDACSDIVKVIIKSIICLQIIIRHMVRRPAIGKIYLYHWLEHVITEL